MFRPRGVGPSTSITASTSIFKVNKACGITLESHAVLRWRVEVPSKPRAVGCWRWGRNKGCVDQDRVGKTDARVNALFRASR